MTSRLSTTRTMRLAQIGALVLAAGGAAIFVLPIATAISPEPAVFETPTGTTSSTAEAEAPQIDYTAAARTLDAINRRELVEAPIVSTTPDETAPQPTENTTDTTAAPAPAAPIEWAYLGSVVSPNNTYALMRAAGTGEQMLFAKGATRHEHTLTEVYPDHVILTDAAGGTLRVELLPPTQSWPEYGPGRMPAAAVASGAALASARPATKGPASPPLSFRNATQTPAAHTAVPPTRAAPIVRELGQTGVPLPNVGTFNFDELGVMMSKVQAQDFDPMWVDSTLAAWGLPADTTFEQKVEFFEKLNVTLDNNSDFLKAIEHNSTRPDRVKENNEGKTEEDQAKINQASLEQEEKEQAEKEQMLKEQLNNPSKKDANSK